MDTVLIPNENDFRRWIKDALKEYFESIPPQHSIAESETGVEVHEALLSRKEIAAIFRISLVTLHKWMKAGIPFHKQGGRVYFFRSEVLAYLKQRDGKMGCNVDLETVPLTPYKKAA